MAQVDISTFFGASDPQKTLAELGFTVATAKAKFPDYAKKWTEWGRTDADFLKNTFMTAAHEQVSWERGSANIHWGAMPGGPGMNGTPLKFNQQLRWPIGRVTGSGVFTASLSDTMVMPDHDRWNGDRKKRNVLASWNYGAVGLHAYHEAAGLDLIRFWGDRRLQYNDPSYESSGWVLSDAGEGSSVGTVKADYFNTYGVLLEKGTPAEIGNISVFNNGLAGVGFVGNEGNSIKIGLLSGDDNLRLFEMVPSAEREAGGGYEFGLIKNESGTTSEAEWDKAGVVHHRYTGQPMVCRGLFNLHIGMLRYSSTHIRSAQLFWVDARLKNGTPVSSRIECRGIGKGAPPNAGFAALLVDSRLGTWYAAPPDETAWHFTYTTIDGVLTLNGKVVQPSGTFPVGAGPMSFARPGETLDFARGLPQQQVTGTAPIPPPVTCTWVLGTPVIGPCQPNGTQEVRTPYVPSIAGCAPPGTKPADQVTSQPCTPPVTGTVIAKLPADPQTGWSNTQAGYKLTVDWKGTRKLDFAGLNPRSLASKSIVRNAAGDRVVIGPDGKIYVNIAGTERTAKNAAGADIVLTANVAQNVTIDLWAPVDFTRVGDSNFTSSTNNNAFVGSWQKLTVSK